MFTSMWARRIFDCIPGYNGNSHTSNREKGWKYNFEAPILSYSKILSRSRAAPWHILRNAGAICSPDLRCICQTTEIMLYVLTYDWFNSNEDFQSPSKQFSQNLPLEPCISQKVVLYTQILTILYSFYSMLIYPYHIKWVVLHTRWTGSDITNSRRWIP